MAHRASRVTHTGCITSQNKGKRRNVITLSYKDTHNLTESGPGLCARLTITGKQSSHIKSKTRHRHIKSQKSHFRYKKMPQPVRELADFGYSVVCLASREAIQVQIGINTFDKSKETMLKPVTSMVTRARISEAWHSGKWRESWDEASKSG